MSKTEETLSKIRKRLEEALEEVEKLQPEMTKSLSNENQKGGDPAKNEPSKTKETSVLLRTISLVLLSLLFLPGFMTLWATFSAGPHDARYHPIAAWMPGFEGGGMGMTTWFFLGFLSFIAILFGSISAVLALIMTAFDN